MKIIFLLILTIFVNCEKLNDGDKIDYYINYTVTPPKSTQRFTYYFKPNFDVGTVEFIIYFSNSALSCHFYIFNGDILIDEINDFYQKSIFHTLKVPEGYPPILRMEVTNYNHDDPYYLYIYNKNYKIPLIFPNYYLYQISLKDLEIQYVINNLPEDTNIKMEAKIQYPQIQDQLQIILYDGINEISHIFDKTSSSFFKLEKNKSYSLKLKPTFNSLFTQYTYFFMTFGNEQDFPILFYQNPTLLFTTILSDNKWYIIDSVNSIDKYNSYNFTFMEGYQNVKDIKINIGIKKYGTYDVDYIKNNTPVSISSYDEIHYLENSNSMNFEACKESYTNDKLILIYIELNYNSEISSLYKYSFKKNIQNQQLKFGTYSINWYTNYEFSPLSVQSKDIIFIQTNHSGTVFPFSGGNYKKFDSFLNGLLFISYLFEDSSKNQVKIIYSDEGVERGYDLDIGMLDVFKFDNELITFDVLNINELVQSKIYLFELKKNYDKYYYIKINQKGNYYVFTEEIDEYYSFFTISEVPISIKEFYQKTSKNETTLLTYGKEYILKIGYSLPEYSLLNMYFLNDDNSRIFDLEEGKVKITTFNMYEERMTLEMNIIQKNISNETYINLRIPSKKKSGNLYVSLDENQDQIYILNNTGVNIYNLKEERTLTINIENNDHIDEDIPILIKLGLRSDKIKPILNDNRSELNYDQFGVFKFPDNKIIKMKFLLESTGLTFNYYTGYLSTDYLNDTSKIISPELINNEKLNSKEHYFEFKTELELNRNVKETKNNINKEESLYLIFSFDGKVEILSGDYIDILPDDSETISSQLILIFSIIGLILIGIGIGIYISIFIFRKYKRNKENLITNKNEIKIGTPQNEKFLDEPYDKPTPEETGEVTDGNEPKYKLADKNYKPQNVTNGENNKINDDRSTLDPEQPAPLPF